MRTFLYGECRASERVTVNENGSEFIQPGGAWTQTMGFTRSRGSFQSIIFNSWSLNKKCWFKNVNTVFPTNIDSPALTHTSLTDTKQLILINIKLIQKGNSSKIIHKEAFVGIFPIFPRILLLMSHWRCKIKSNFLCP